MVKMYSLAAGAGWLWLLKCCTNVDVALGILESVGCCGC